LWVTLKSCPPLTNAEWAQSSLDSRSSGRPVTCTDRLTLLKLIHWYVRRPAGRITLTGLHGASNEFLLASIRWQQRLETSETIAKAIVVSETKLPVIFANAGVQSADWVPWRNLQSIPAAD